MPAPYRARGAAALEENQKCVGCHPAEAQAWQGSFHQRAFTNAAFQTAFKFEPTPFCGGCHAPEATNAVKPAKAEADAGVTCVTCHVAGEHVLAAPNGRPDGVERGEAHTVERSAAFGHTGGCASCHEFRFPEARSGGPESFMQTTVQEHARSPASDRSCASCHMPMKDGRRSHAFDVRDPAWLRDHFTATAERTDDGRVEITIGQKLGGHALPTGDLFRRLQVGAEIRSTAREAARREAAYLARHFQLIPGVKGRELARDDRVFFEPRVVSLDPAKGASSTGPITWWVTLERVAQALEGVDPERAVVESRQELFRGTLPPASAAAQVRPAQ